MGLDFWLLGLGVSRVGLKDYAFSNLLDGFTQAQTSD